MASKRTRFGLMRKKWVWLLILVGICGVLAAHFLLDAGQPVVEKPPASLPAAGDVACLGRLLPGGRILQVAAPPGAVIGKLLAQRGQWVERGEVLARLRDHALAAAAFNQAEKEVAVAQAELVRVRAGEKTATIEAQQAAVSRQKAILSQAEAHYERYRKLYERQIISASDFEEAQTRRDTARESLLWEQQHLGELREIRKEDLDLAADKVAAADEARKVARERVELNLIRAPVSGCVLDIHTFPGEAVQERGILELGSGRDMMVEAEVYVSDIGRVRLNAPAVVSGDAFRQSLKGRVVEMTSTVTRSAVMPTDPLAFSDRRVVKVMIRLDDPGSVAHLGNHQVSVAIKP